MPYLITVPEKNINITDQQTGSVIDSRNYFWLMINEVMISYANRLNGLQLLDFSEFYKTIRLQVGQKTLAIDKETDYELLKKLVENHVGWIGNRAAEDGPEVINAVRKAEKK